MPYPQRYNPVAIEIKTLSRSTSLLDSDFNEPITSRTYSSPLSIKGQVWYNNTEDREAGVTGDQDQTDGHFVMTKKQMISDGILNGTTEVITIKKGDIIIKIAGKEVRYEITRIDPQAHLRGVSNTYHFYFNDPVRERGTIR